MLYGNFKHALGVHEIDETVEQEYNSYAVLVDIEPISSDPQWIHTGRMLPLRDLEFDGKNRVVILYV